ncbi:amidohydrolase family protein [Dasania marina]|uniref:amidohydrolase n=1 Tax=Dasania marina TaxID=471499 RepID=UPI0030D94C75|tara:strand:- start:84809 stop:86839 length:2031 start_codon:yes stop_codon:yes gene_type:complete
MLNKKIKQHSAVLLSAALLTACDAKEAGTTSKAEHVFSNAYIYTADQYASVVDTMAIADGRIIYTGSKQGVAEFIGDNTQQHDLAGKMLLPGFHDVHIHALDIVEREACDFNSEAMSLDSMVDFLRSCIQRYQIAEGQWLDVALWNFYKGNEPSQQYPTLRAALDAVSTKHPIVLRGNDGHHYAVNSVALARAEDQQGVVVGINKQTLVTDFHLYKELVAVDARGEPSGGLTESAVALVQSPSSIQYENPEKFMPQVAEKLAQSGITSIMDALLEPRFLSAFKWLEDSGNMTFRLQAAIKKYYDYPRIEQRLSIADIPATVAGFKVVRDEYAKTQYIRADAAKILVDGVIEGNPYAFPPTLPNAAMLQDYQQPIFSVDEETGTARLTGYVDFNSEACKQVKTTPMRFEANDIVKAFTARHGFHPMQCISNKGVFETAPEFVKAYALELDKQGFTIHAHAIGDAAVRASVDAIEHARKVNGHNNLPHAIAHAQVVHPDDQKRIGDLGIYMAFTHAWSNADPEYQLMVEPFIDRLSSGAQLFNSNNYYSANVYPTNSLQKLGAVITAGSDAPVDTRDPRPFVNIEQAITRSYDEVENPKVLNAGETLDIHSILRAYTINGARAMSQADMLGSIEVGKKADFIIISQNIVALAEQDKANEISDTQVLSTWFDGRLVYTR